jgi:general secretion pathway protein A
MYLSFFGLAEKPFAITPDPRYLYLSARHADALAHLVYGINEAGGFIQLTGEVGTGKTTTIRSLLARAPKDAEIALILNPRLSAGEFLLSLCEELGLGADDNAEGTKELVDLLNRYLLRAHAEGRRVVLIVDEAQNLDPEVLEQIRLLTNLETETQKLLQIILIGQPELRTLLARQDLRQLAQRITSRYHLDPLSSAETAAYVRHRLRVAGATADIFTAGALRQVYKVSHGIPRVINIVCDRALLGAYTQDLHQVPAALVRRAGAEIFDQELSPAWMPLLIGSLALVVLAGSATLLWRYSSRQHPAERVAQRVSSAAPAVDGHDAVPAASAASNDPVAEPSTRPALTSASMTSGSPPTVSTPPVAAGAVGLQHALAENLHGTDSDSAFAALLGLWKAQYVPGKTDGCSQALAQGLQCLERRGSLAQLRLLNRPAILMLSDEAGTPYQVVLRGLTYQSAQLQVGSQELTVDVAELTRYWFGDFVLLWHPGARDVRDLSVGMRGGPVRRLRQQLDRWSGVAPGNAANDEYDPELKQMVEQFQRANRLMVDGIAGLETQVALDAALAAPDTPTLGTRPAQQASARGT